MPVCFYGNVAAPILAVLILLSSPISAAELTHGPMIGHVTPESAFVWARASLPGAYLLRLFAEGEKEPLQVLSASTTEKRDFTLVWEVKELQPGKKYLYEISLGTEVLAHEKDQQFSTPLSISAENEVKLAIGSCSWEVSHPKQPVWTAMAAEQVDAVLLIGDTPYIDSTDLAVQRQRYRTFWLTAELKDLVRHTPIYATWDDHDFGPDDALGMTPGKENSRQAFLEYHANPSYGLDNQGIFTKFRRGPVEVFLIDPRWFSNTEPSPFFKDRKTLIGQIQWDWLRRSLKESTAPLKLLITGMIWNEAAYPGKRDYWMAYPYEREGIFKSLKEDGIKGVILIGGDIHRSRHFIHPTKQRVGYDLHEFVTSPLAENTVPENNIPSPYLQYDAALDDSYLQLNVASTAQGVTVRADFHSRNEIKHTVNINVADLK